MSDKDCDIKLPQETIQALGNRDYAVVYAHLEGNQIRNKCWNCKRYFIIHDSSLYLEIEHGQKVYLKCNHCEKVNHL